MTKTEFAAVLRAKLSSLPQADRDRSVEYYGEMIDERMEEGFSEEEAVAVVGPVENIAEGILAETPAAPKKRGAGRIVLWILAFPLFLVLICTAVSIYAALWACVISIFAAALGCAAGAVAGPFLLGLGFVYGEVAQGVFLFGCAVTCGGLAILLFLPGMAAGKAAVFLGRKMFGLLKKETRA